MAGDVAVAVSEDVTRERQSMQQTARLKLAFNPVAAEDGQGVVFSGGLQHKLRDAMAENGWEDFRFVTERQVRNAGWALAPDAKLLQMEVRGSNGASLAMLNLYNASQVVGMPSLEDMLKVAAKRWNEVVQSPAATLAPMAAEVGKERAAVSVADDLGLEVAPADDGGLLVGPSRRSLAHGADHFEELVGVRPSQRVLTQLAPSLRFDEPAVVPEPVVGGSEVLQPPSRAADAWAPVLLGQRFKERVEGSGEYFREGASKPAFMDQGESLFVKDKSADSYQAVMELARKKGWTEIELTGKPEQLAQGWIEAQLMGIKVANFLPQEKDWQALDARRAEMGLPAADRQALLPEGAELVSAGRHIGPVKAIENGYVVQDVGQGKLVAHPLGEFVPVPVAGDKLDVRYQNGRVASWYAPTQEVGKGLGR